MALLTTIALTIGGALVKHVVAGYLGDGIKSQVAPDLLDLVRDQIGDGLTARPQQPSIEQVGQQVTQKLLPVFAQESRHLDQATREAIVLAVAQTLATSKIDADLLLHQRLDPARLANTLHEKAATSRAGFSPDETTLYRRLLTESCRQLVYIANHFAGYEILLDRRLLTGQDEVLAQLARLLAEPDKQSRDYADAYRTQLSKQLNKFEQIGIDYAERATARQPLDVAYVALRLMQGDGSSYEELSARHTRRDQRDDGFAEERPRRAVGSLPEMLTYTPRLVIQGQPGSGKSTMLRWLAIQLAQRTLSQEQPALASWDDCIPFYIKLRTFANRTLPTPSEWPTLQVRQLALKPPDTWIHEVLSDGRAVVLIDGVDETPQGQRAELLQWLQEVMSAYPWARYIITSRPAAIKLWPEWIDWSRSSGFLTLSLQEMELEQCFGFIKQWHDALQQSLPDPTQREEVAALVEPLKQLVRQRDTLRRLARNPLLCSMICALHREHPQTIPQNRIKLYQDCVDMLMHRRDAERKVGSLADYPPLSNIHEEVVLSNYAYHLMRNGASEETIDEADDYFDQLIQKMNMPGWSAKRLRHYFVARTGLLIEPSEERIAFAHLTFQEFLAAQKIVEENDIGMLIDKAGEDKWRETILLTIGTKGIRQAQSDRLLNGLLNKANDTTIPGHRHEIYLLAVACLETAIYLTPPMRRLILNKAATLIPPRDVDAINLIAKGGDPIVELLRFNSRYSFTKMALCVAALIAIGSEQALKAIVEYATSPVYKDEGAEPLRQAVTRGLFTFDPTYYCQQVLCYISTLDLSKAQSIVSVLPHLQGLTNLQSLDLTGNEVNEVELLYLQNFISLQSLKLEFNQVTDTDLLYLQNLNKLQILDLSSNQVSDAGLPHLQSLTELQSLNLSYNEISDGGLSYLRGWIRLQSLKLSGTQISDIGLVNLLELTELQSLKLSHTEVSSAGLLHLKNLAELQSLDLSGTRITNEGLLHLKNLANLKLLNLSGTRISSVGLLHLQSLTALQSLDLSNTQISNAGLLNLQNLNNLQSLNINHTQINDSGLLHLQKLMSLQSLDLGSTQVSDAGLQHLKSLVGLLSLDLNNTRIGNAGLLCLQSLTNLQSLDLGRTRISDAGLQHLKGLSGLRSLNLSGTQVSDIGLLHLRDLASLQSLDLSSTQISNAGLRHLKNLSKLQFLSVPYTEVQDVSALDHLPELNIEIEVPF